MDKKKIEKAIRDVLVAVGENPNRRYKRYSEKGRRDV